MAAIFDTPTLTSIIIPCYKNTKWLDRAIASCLEQSTATIEIIVVNDGNQDSQIEQICKGFDVTNITYIKSEHRGSSAARNIGLKHAKGNYIKFLDADDSLGAESIATQLHALQHSGADAVYSDWCIERIVFGNIPLRYDVISGHKNSELLAAILKKDWLPIGSLLYRRDIIDRIGGWDERFIINDDFVFNVKLLASGAVFQYEPILSQIYRRHNYHSLSSTFSTSKIAAWNYLNSVNETLNYLESLNINNLNPTIREAMAWQYRWLSNRWYEFDRLFSLKLKERAQALDNTGANSFFHWQTLEKAVPQSISTALSKTISQSLRAKNKLFEMTYLFDLLETASFPIKKTISCLKAKRRHWLS